VAVLVTGIKAWFEDDTDLVVPETSLGSQNFFQTSRSMIWLGARGIYGVPVLLTRIPIIFCLLPKEPFAHCHTTPKITSTATTSTTYPTVCTAKNTPQQTVCHCSTTMVAKENSSSQYFLVASLPQKASLFFVS